MLCLFIGLFLFSPLQAQKEVGLPLIQAYTFKQLNKQLKTGITTQSWAITQDEKGIVYFGNGSGLIAFDGEKWEAFPVTNRSTVRSIAYDGKTKRIYAGAVNELGYYDVDSIGQMRYHSLVEHIPKEHREFNNVWKTYRINDAVYYQSFKYIFVWKDQEITTILPQSSYHLSTMIADTLFVMDRKVGLSKVEDNQLKLIQDGDLLKNKRVYGMVEIQSGRQLLFTRSHGIYERLNGKIQQVPIDFEKVLSDAQVYHACKLADGRIAVATVRDGLFILSADGRSFLQHIREADGLTSNGIFYIYEDLEKGLWLAQSSGISRVDLGSPVTVFNDKHGMKGKTNNFIRHQGEIYVGTSLGMMKLVRDKTALSNAYRLEEMPLINTPIWAFEAIDEDLIIAASQGLFLLRNGRLSEIQSGYALRLTPSEKFENTFYIRKLNTFNLLVKKDNNWIVQPAFEAIKGQIQTSVELNGSELWVSVNETGIMKFDISNGIDHTSKPIKTFTEEHGLPSLRRNILFTYQGELVAGTQYGFYRFDEKEQRFVEDARWGIPYNPDEKQSFIMHFAPDGTPWTGIIFDPVAYGVKQADEETFKWVHQPFMQIPDNTVRDLIFEKDSILWITSTEGLFRYDLAQGINKDHSFKSLIRKVSLLKNDSLLQGGYGTGMNRESGIKLPYQFNSLRFEYAVSSFVNPESNQYQFKLEGYDEDWSNFTTESKRDVTNLDEGSYTFRLRARNLYEQMSEEVQFEFEVLPPWYRSYFAYAVYLIGAIALVWLVTVLNSKRLRQANEKLERIVKDRTAEVRSQNETLIQQKEELKLQHEEISAQHDYIEGQNSQLKEQHIRITDSIRYAQTIQEGMLPFNERMEQALNEYFVLYRPKDIVSGDFYWFEQIGNQKLMAVVDCTGHGVPGAFMSMIGISILNDIVIKEHYTSPKDILEKLDLLVRRVLKQDSNASNQDGMDAAICAWEEKEDGIHLSFAGAKRPMYLIKNQEFIQYKGAVRSIGGYQGKKGDKPFENTTLIIPKNSTVYLTTDGYADQNGLDNPKKIGSPKLRKLLQDNDALPLVQQKEILEKFLNEYQKDVEQRDDITIIGFRV